MSLVNRFLYTERVARRLGDGAVGVYPKAVMHVPIETAREARQIAREFGADCAVAIGGGSTTANPRRWARHTRNWQPIAVVTLNPERECIVHDAASKVMSTRPIYEIAAVSCWETSAWRYITSSVTRSVAASICHMRRCTP